MSTIGTTASTDSKAMDGGYDSYAYEEDRGSGWLLFSAAMLGLAGTIGLIAGIVAIADSSYYVAGSRYVFSDLHTWGWIVTLVGVATLLAAVGVLSRSQAARWFGVFVASLQAIAQLLFIQAYPFWSLCVFTIDILVIYGLVVYGGRRASDA